MGFELSLEGWVRKCHQAYKAAADRGPQGALEPSMIYPGPTAPALGRYRRHGLDKILRVGRRPAGRSDVLICIVGGILPALPGLWEGQRGSWLTASCLR